MLMHDTWPMIAWNFARNILGIFVGTAGIVGFAFSPMSAWLRVAFGVAAVAILIPQHAFAGADMLDWLGLGGALLVLAVNWLQARNARHAAAPQPTGS